MNKTKIDWGIPGLLTWNPVTGCKRGCSYCYARRIHKRFNKTPFSDIVVHPERMADPLKRIKPANIFVGSMSDIEYWPQNNIRHIIEVCKYTPHEFYFLSKNPISYVGYSWPKNCTLGLTMTGTESKRNQETCLSYMGHFEKIFISIEPVLGELKTPVNNTRLIAGPMTGPGAIKPKPEWIESIKRNANNVYWKKKNQLKRRNR